MVKSNKKRKNRHSGGYQNRNNATFRLNQQLVPPPPLPQIDVPAFQLSTNDDGNDTEDSQTKHATKKPKKEKQPRRVVPEFCVSPAKMKRVVRVSDLQQLVLWLLADGIAAQWLLVKRKQDIQKVVVVMAPGLDMALLDGTVDLIGKQVGDEDDDMGEVLERNDGDGLNCTENDVMDTADVEEGEIKEDHQSEESEWITVGSKKDPEAKPFSFYPSLLSGRPLPPCLTPLRKIFTHVWPTKTDGDDKYNQIHSPISHFLNCNLEKSSQPYNPKKRIPTRIGITQLLMTPQELDGNEYPLHSSTLRRLRQGQGVIGGLLEEPTEREQLKEDGWVETDVTGLEEYTHNEAGSVTEGRKIYAVDCEMCNTEVGPELTRISVVGWDGTAIYDTLVKPSRPIVDYLTQ